MSVSWLSLRSRSPVASVAATLGALDLVHDGGAGVGFPVSGEAFRNRHPGRVEAVNLVEEFLQSLQKVQNLK